MKKGRVIKIWWSGGEGSIIERERDCKREILLFNNRYVHIYDVTNEPTNKAVMPACISYIDSEKEGVHIIRRIYESKTGYTGEYMVFVEGDEVEEVQGYRIEGDVFRRLIPASLELEMCRTIAYKRDGTIAIVYPYTDKAKSFKYITKDEDGKTEVKEGIILSIEEIGTVRVVYDKAEQILAVEIYNDIWRLNPKVTGYKNVDVKGSAEEVINYVKNHIEGTAPPHTCQWCG